jgi:hypothetical protein
MTLSDPTDAQRAAMQTRKRGRSATEKRRLSAQRVQRHPSDAAGTERKASIREKDRLRKRQAQCDSKENTPPPLQQESTPSDEAVTALPTAHRPPWRSLQQLHCLGSPGCSLNDGRAEPAMPNNDGSYNSHWMHQQQ